MAQKSSPPWELSVVRLPVLDQVNEKNTGVILSQDSKGNTTRVSVKQWNEKTTHITLAIFVGGFSWVETQLKPEDAAKVAALILDKPALKVARPETRAPWPAPTVDTSREAVEQLADSLEIVDLDSETPNPEAAAVLRSLLDQRDTDRAQITDLIADNDALRFEHNNMAFTITTLIGTIESMRNG